MKILIVSDTYLPPVGGAEVHIEELARHFRLRGHAVHLFVTEPHTISGETDITRVAWHGNFIEVFWKLLGTIIFFKPDIIAAHYSYRLAAVAGVAAKLKGIPMTVTLHGLGTLPEPYAHFISRVKLRTYRWLSLACATSVIATSHDMLRAVPWVAKKTVIIPNGADADRFNPLNNTHDPVLAQLRARFTGRKIILTVRRLNPKCGIQYLVEALPEIIKHHPDVLYVMVGTGRLEEEIRGRIKKLGIEHNVEMVGLVPNANISQWLALADVVVFPSTAESTSISCIEAMLMGKAIVASAVGGLLELLGRDGSRGILVKLVDWEHSDYGAPDISVIPRERFTHLANVVSEMLDNPQERARMGSAAQAYALTHFTWSIVSEKTIELFKKVLVARV